MRTEQKILNAALKLFIERGIDTTSTASITKEAEVSTGLLFHYFHSKEDLVLSLYSQVIQEFLDVGFKARNTSHTNDLESFEENLRLSVEARIRWGLDNWNKFLFKRQLEVLPYYGNVNRDKLPGIDKYYEWIRTQTNFAIENHFVKSFAWFFVDKLGGEIIAAITEFLHEHQELINNRDTWDEMWSYYWDAIRHQG